MAVDVYSIEDKSVTAILDDRVIQVYQFSLLTTPTYTRYKSAYLRSWDTEYWGQGLPDVRSREQMRQADFYWDLKGGTPTVVIMVMDKTGVLPGMRVYTWEDRFCAWAYNDHGGPGLGLAWYMGVGSLLTRVGRFLGYVGEVATIGRRPFYRITPEHPECAQYA